MTENPKHKQGDGAGFGRLRAEQAKRETFAAICGRSHPSCKIHIDKIYEYAGTQIAFYRAVREQTFEHARVAVFIWNNPSAIRAGYWSKENDIIAAQADI